MPKVKRVILGLTGGYGSGKSFVSSVFRSLGARVVDADALAREALAPGRPAARRVARDFGPGVLDARRRIDRKRLAARVFADPAARRRLEGIVHPEVIRALRAAARDHRRRGLLVLDIPLLFETRLQALADKTAVVWAPEAVRLRRLARRGVSPADYRRRARAQWPLRRKTARADFVIDNSGPRAATRRRVRRLFRELTSPSV